ncbi:COG4315 family predicted lipoprotein [Metaplanococcus flavidus]|uniref:Lipoprotein n=1 Tax=Metaplanococcus flavidus TaxID=569883 RepID=A0ABW3L7W2_9BACL
MEKRLLLFIVIFMVAVLTACGNGEGDTTGGYSGPDDKPDEPIVSEEGEQSAQTLQLMENEDTGPYLADSDGMTLYYFTNDEMDTSNCTGDCLVNWPAFTASEVEVPEGYAESDFSTITREDNGEMQVTYKGYPLYYFINDMAEGDVTGQGVNDAWYVVNDETEFPE